MMKEISHIKQWHELTAIDERTAILTGRSPVVIRGMASQWPIVNSAQNSFIELARYLTRFDSGAIFEAMIARPSESGRLFYTEDMQKFNFDCMKGYLRDALDILGSQIGKSGAPAFYIGSTNIARFFPGMELECKLPFLDESIVPNIWIGNAVNVATHNDNAENIACVAAGRRRFTLFPPQQEKNLYIGDQKQTPGGRPISLVDLRNPDFHKFPLFQEALSYCQVAELNPGDAIYIPEHWWHNVESLDDVNILINFWWKGDPPRLPE